jgi:hypothetical protein
MGYDIWVFNQRKIEQDFTTLLISDLRSASFGTLCRQYGLDPGLIEPTLNNLEVISGVESHVPFFMLKYRTGNETPIVVSFWSLMEPSEREWFKQWLLSAPRGDFRQGLSKAQFAFRIELTRAQLQDMGLLLGYECARWLAYQGLGLVRGLDQKWYYLNQHQAFLPC